MKLTRKKLYLQILLPIIAAILLLIGLTIGIPYIVRAKHNYPQKVTIELKNPNINSSFPYDSQKFDNKKFIEYWMSGTHMMAPYVVDYRKEFNSLNNSEKTLGNYIDKWNNNSGLSSKLFELKKFGTMGRYLSGYLNSNHSDVNKYLPLVKNGFLTVTSSTNSNSKNSKHNNNNYALNNTTSKGIDQLYLQTDDIINIINWYW